MDVSELEAWHAALPTSPCDAGTVRVVVQRPEKGERATPDSIELDPETGIAGDRWSAVKDPERKAQVSVMNAHVVADCAGTDDPARTALSGDNLLVDLELSTENLPTGSVLEIGDVRLVVTDQPHMPCKLFKGRYGADAARRIAWSVDAGYRGRGLMCRIERGGRISVGDAIRVTRA